MGIAFIYNLFDGCELLKACLTNAKNHNVDENIVIFQKKSYYGNIIDTYDIQEVIDYYLAEGLIDKAIEYDLSMPASCHKLRRATKAKWMESRKYQMGLDYVYEKNIDYFRLCAIDEFFMPKEFESAMSYIKKNNIDRSYCGVKTYCDIDKEDTKNTDNINTTFIYKTLYPRTDIKNKIGYQGKGQIVPDIRIDQMARYGDSNNSYIFDTKDLLMHHYRLSRINIFDKSNNSSAARIGVIKSQANNIDSIRSNGNSVPNYFDINYDEFKKLFHEKSYSYNIQKKQKCLIYGYGKIAKIHAKYLDKNNIDWFWYDPYNTGPKDKKAEIKTLNNFDRILICSPEDKHYENYKTIRDSGYQNYVFIEKPAAISDSHILEISQDSKAIIGMVERFNPAVQTLKNIIDLDKIINIDFSRCCVADACRNVSTIEDIGIHDLDLMFFLLGAAAHSIQNCNIIHKKNTTLFSCDTPIIRMIWSKDTFFKERKIIVRQTDCTYEVDLQEQSVVMHFGSQKDHISRSIYVEKSSAIENEHNNLFSDTPEHIDFQASHLLLLQLLKQNNQNNEQ